MSVIWVASWSVAHQLQIISFIILRILEYAKTDSVVIQSSRVTSTHEMKVLHDAVTNLLCWYGTTMVMFACFFLSIKILFVNRFLIVFESGRETTH